MWSFTVLAPGMDSHTTDRPEHTALPAHTTNTPSHSNSTAEHGPSNIFVKSLKWVMRGSYRDACSPNSAVAVDAAHADDAAHQEANTAIVAASLANPNRIVLQTSSHAFSARATATTLVDPEGGGEICTDANKIKAMKMATVAAHGFDVAAKLDASLTSSAAASPNPTVAPSPNDNATSHDAGVGHTDSAEELFLSLVRGGKPKKPSKQSCHIIVQQLVPHHQHHSDESETSNHAHTAADPDPSVLIGLSCAYFGADGSSSPPPPVTTTPTTSDSPTDAAAPSPAETQHQYNTRTLSTPLLWEEPRSFFIDCRRSGMYLWSEDGVEYGRKIFDKCLETPAAGTTTNVKTKVGGAATPHVAAHAEIRLKWHDALHENGSTDASPQIHVSLLDRKDGSHAKETAAFTWRLPKGTVVSDLVPSVTFLTEFCRASIVPPSVLE